MRKYIIFFRGLILILLFCGTSLYSQTGLQIMPHTIRFENRFDRIKKLYFINNGSNAVRLDSIVYDRQFFLFRYDTLMVFPYYLNPGDTLRTACILYNNFAIPGERTHQKISVYSNVLREIDITIGFYHSIIPKGKIQGAVSDSISGIADVDLYFFREGIILVDSAKTNAEGLYEIVLPAGDYTIGAERHGYYSMFYNDKFSPIDADFTQIENNSIVTANLLLKPVIETGSTVNGSIIDAVSGAALKKSIVVIKKGNHNPRKLSVADDRDTYVVFSSINGRYNFRDIPAGNYILQAFSPYYIPGYYNRKNHPAPEWQKADTVSIDGNVENLDMYLSRDSSYGDGTVSGRIVQTDENSAGGYLVLTQSTDNGEYYSYSFTKKSGYFRGINLPYGKFRLVIQKSGAEQVFSREFEISSSNIYADNLNVPMSLSNLAEEEFPGIDYKLYQNYPNPFNPTTNFGFRIADFGFVQLKIFDLIGREVATIVNKEMEAGEYHIQFDGSSLPTGVYIYVLNAGGYQLSNKACLIK